MNVKCNLQVWRRTICKTRAQSDPFSSMQPHYYSPVRCCLESSRRPDTSNGPFNNWKRELVDTRLRHARYKVTSCQHRLSLQQFHVKRSFSHSSAIHEFFCHLSASADNIYTEMWVCYLNEKRNGRIDR